MAGTIDSRSGSASVVPMPRRIVRRDSALFVTNIVSSLDRSLPAHLKRRALHDPENHGGEPVVLGGGVTKHAADDRHVVLMQTAPQAVGQEFLGERPDEDLGASEQ